MFRGGRIVRGESELGVRTMGRIDAVSQFRDIIVSNINGTPIRLSDLGRVEDTHGEVRNWNMLDGRDAVTLEIRRQAGSNTVKIVDTVKARLDQIEKTLPSGMTMRIIQDQSVFIKASTAVRSGPAGPAAVVGAIGVTRAPPASGLEARARRATKAAGSMAAPRSIAARASAR